MPSQTPYTDLYQALNRHLTTSSVESGRPPREVGSDTRGPIRILGHETAVRTALSVTFKFSDAMFSGHTYYYPRQTAQLEKRTIRALGVYIDVDYRWSTEYYHFLAEVLPNALFLHNRYPTAPIFCTKRAFTEPLFRWFGISAPIVERPYPSMGRASADFVECGNPNPDTVARLRSIVVTKVAFETTHGILIRRHGTRVVRNEEELFEECRSRYPTLTWVVFDALPTDETAALFSKAAVIVAPHGAGLTNMIFSASGVEIYEFMPLDAPNICYWHLAEALGHRYTMIPQPSSYDTHAMTCHL